MLSPHRGIDARGVRQVPHYEADVPLGRFPDMRTNRGWTSRSPVSCGAGLELVTRLPLTTTDCKTRRSDGKASPREHSPPAHSSWGNIGATFERKTTRNGDEQRGARSQVRSPFGALSQISVPPSTFSGVQAAPEPDRFALVSARRRGAGARPRRGGPIVGGTKRQPDQP